MMDHFSFWAGWMLGTVTLMLLQAILGSRKGKEGDSSPVPQKELPEQSESPSQAIQRNRRTMWGDS